MNSATAADYDGDGTQEIIFSAGHQILMYVGPEYKEQNILAESDSKQKPQCIHCVLHDVDNDGDLDFVGSYVQGLFWLECPDKNATKTKWKMHQITDQIHGVHCIRSFDIDSDGTADLVANDFTVDKGPFSGSICWLKPSDSSEDVINWKIIPLLKIMRRVEAIILILVTLMEMAARFDSRAKGKPFADGNYFAVFYAPKDTMSRGVKNFYLMQANKLVQRMQPRQT